MSKRSVDVFLQQNLLFCEGYSTSNAYTPMEGIIWTFHMGEYEI